MRALLLTAVAALTVAGGGAAHAVTVVDPTGDFLPSFVGDPLLDTDLDVTAFSVTFDSVANSFKFDATFAGAINPARSGLYAIGVNTGTGPIAPFGGIGNPNVIFNQVIAVQKTGAVAIGMNNSLTASISGNRFSLIVPLALLPTTGFTPNNYGFNLWPRNGLGNNNQISDFAPNNANFSAVPEPATWAMLLAGFTLLGGALRHRRTARHVPVGAG